MLHMSPKNKILRRVVNPPIIKGFKPYGPSPGTGNTEPVALLYEEYESIRLCDYDGCNHYQASVMMSVSRPTFTRIYASALQKIAKAFVEGRQISIGGGQVYFDSSWFHCTGCHCYFNNPEKDQKIDKCPLCGSQQVKAFDYSTSPEDDETNLCDDYCICPNCGYEQVHQPGRPCSQEACPECGSRMKRKGTPGYRNLNNRMP